MTGHRLDCRNLDELLTLPSFVRENTNTVDFGLVFTDGFKDALHFAVRFLRTPLLAVNNLRSF